MTFFFVCSVTVTHHYTYRNTAILQDHSHSPKTKQKNSHDFKRITHMGGFKFNELSDDARTCCAYTRSNSLQEQEDTAVYAVNEAAWRSLAAKGVGATGQTSQKRKKKLQRADAMACHRPIGAVRTRGSHPCPWIPRIHHWGSAPVALSGKARRLRLVRHCRCRILLLPALPAK